MNQQRYLKKKITYVIGFMMLILLSIILTNRFFNQQQLANQQAQLTRDAEWMIRVLELENRERWEAGHLEKAKRYLAANQHLDFYDPTGEKIGTDVQETGFPPEIQAILNQNQERGSAVRNVHQATSYVYLAYPVKFNHELQGIVRISEPLRTPSKRVKQFQYALIGIEILLFLLVSLSLWIIDRHKKAPLQYAVPILKDFLSHPENHHELSENSQEWGILYEVLNDVMKETNDMYYQNLITEERFSFLLEHLSIGIIVHHEQLNGDVRVTKNSVAENWLYRQNGLQAQLDEMITNLKPLRRDWEEEITLNYPEFQVINVSLKWLNTSNAIERDDYVIMLYDLTPIRKIEQIQHDFIRNLSHELKTPITSIIGFSETLLDSALEESEVAREFVQIIEKEAKRLSRLIQDMLLLSRTVETFDEQIAHKESIGQLITEEINLYQPLIKQKNLSVIPELDDESHHCLFPSVFLQPIIKNLLENACLYTAESGTIKIQTTVYENELILTVTDNGCGIPEEEQNRIFERFYRVSKSRQRHTGGSGLGLAIVAHYVELLEGSIELQSKLRDGTTFKVTLPITN
ncbi:ATP-binding protein [Vagococcus lutrae]|uniref:sensor histidine kinase n=1 Tax=Vagococcus lutrae TaxID=81947 RepID=UPI002892421C|nr:ATP-binding protein [Vagococcus lutrae]MDT2817169.1 ATP-binding protein [Vagococcus lutrae]